MVQKLNIKYETLHHAFGKNVKLMLYSKGAKICRSAGLTLQETLWNLLKTMNCGAQFEKCSQFLVI